MNKAKKIFGILAMAAIFEESMHINNQIPKKILQEDKKRSKVKRIPKNCIEFNIEGVTIYARNEKNALRKFKNLKTKKSNTTSNTKTD